LPSCAVDYPAGTEFRASSDTLSGPEPGGDGLIACSRSFRHENRSRHGLKLAKLQRQCSHRYADAPMYSFSRMLMGTA